MNTITIRVPATTANLGPGFDCLGLALGLYTEVSFAPTGDSLVITGCDSEYAGPENLAYQAFQAVLTRLGRTMPGLHIHIDANIPISRGLGSSAALLAAGAMGANALCGGTLSKEELLAITTEIEGHPDNLAPAFYGGLVASMMNNGQPVCAPFPLWPDWHFLALIPDFPLSTRMARSVLPEQVSRENAIFNISHALLLMKALETGDEGLLSQALDDRLHQRFRRGLIHDFDAVEALVKERGGALCVSGAGPTLMCITKDPGLARTLAGELPHRVQHRWQVLPLRAEPEGACEL